MATRKHTRSLEHPKGYDRDHILYTRREWTASKLGRVLRNTQWLIPHLDREVHEAKHDAVSFVPTLGAFVLGKVAREFSPVVGDHLASIEGLLSTIEDARLDQRLPSDERAYAGSTVDAIDRQLPFIRAGIISSHLLLQG